MATSPRTEPSDTTRRGNTSGDETKAKILDATLVTLKADGIVGTSARAIAKTGDFNQALIFYHFGSVDDAVLGAVASMSQRRLAEHKPKLDRVTSLPELITVARELHEGDVAENNMTVFAQAFAGATAKPELGPKLYDELRPWRDLVTQTIDRVLADVPMRSVIDTEQISQIISALFLGIELMDDLDPAATDADGLFDTLEGLARILDLLLKSPALAVLAGDA